MSGNQWHVVLSTSSINDKPHSETGRISPIGSAGDVSHVLAISSMGQSKSTTTDPYDRNSSRWILRPTYSGAIFKHPPPAEPCMSQKKRCTINNIYVTLLHLCTCQVSSLMDDCCVCGKRFFPFLATLTMHAKVNNVNSSWLARIFHAVKYPLTRAMAPHLTPTKKAHIWHWHLEGKSNNWIAEQFGRDRRAIDRLRQNTDTYAVTTGRGRLRAISKHDLLEAHLELKRGHAHDGEDIRRLLFPKLAASTVRKALATSGMSGRVRRKKPLLSRSHILKRRKWEQANREMTLEEWTAVWFSDESKFNLIGSDGKCYCRRDVGEEYLDRNLQKVVKHGGGHIMVWGVVTWDGPGRLIRVAGNMDSRQYCKILKEGLLGTLQDQSLEPEDIVFAQDNDPKHVSRYTKAWLHDNEIHLLGWPPSSPDMNIIEHCWAAVDRSLRRRGVLPTNLEELWSMLEEEWGKLDVEFIRTLYRSIPDRLEALRQSHGGVTCY